MGINTDRKYAKYANSKVNTAYISALTKLVEEKKIKPSEVIRLYLHDLFILTLATAAYSICHDKSCLLNKSDHNLMKKLNSLIGKKEVASVIRDELIVSIKKIKPRFFSIGITAHAFSNILRKRCFQMDAIARSERAIIVTLEDENKKLRKLIPEAGSDNDILLKQLNDANVEINRLNDKCQNMEFNLQINQCSLSSGKINPEDLLTSRGDEDKNTAQSLQRETAHSASTSIPSSFPIFCTPTDDSSYERKSTCYGRRSSI